MQMPVLCSLFENTIITQTQLTTAQANGWVPVPNDARNGNLTTMQTQTAGVYYRPASNPVEDF